MYKLSWLVQGLCLSVFLVACGGGGGGGGQSDDANSDNTTNGEVNDDLSGTLFIGGEDEGWKLDLQTGRYSRIPGVDWERQNQNTYPSSADLSAYPMDYDGSKFLLKVENCRRTQNANYPSRYDDCVMTYSAQGQQQGSPGILLQDMVGTPKLSRNGDYIAFFYDQYGSGSAAELALVITDLNFSIVSAAPVLVSGAYTASSPSLTWLTDNRLAYTFDEDIYLSDAALNASSTAIATFSAAQGEPRDIAASPDGQQLAFVLQTDSSSRTVTATPWVINIDGTGLRQLARVSDGRRPSFENPTWSPDGNKILFTHGRVTAANPTDLGLQGGGYVIPADSNNILLSQDPNVQQIRSYFGMTSGRNNSELTTDFDIDEGPIAWLPN